MPSRPSAAELHDFATTLLVHTGLEREKAAAVGEILVEGDLLGHSTHGLALLPAYLNEVEKGGMTPSGQPAPISDYPSALTWDGNRLPGPWLVLKAIDVAISRARTNGIAAVVIRRSHHIGCLAAYLQRVAEQGLMVLLTCSDPNTCSVAPFGGRREVFTPNPIAAAWPTAGDPVIFDTSTSITTNGLTSRLHKEGKRFPGEWALTAEGEATNDPAVLFAKPPGTLLPTGGVDHGHKGYAWSLLVETLTGALAGHGRADPREGWGATVFVQVMDPNCFGGLPEFARQTEHIAKTCRETPARAGFERVRLPGESGIRRRREQLEHGVELHPAIMPALKPWGEKLGVALKTGM